MRKIFTLFAAMLIALTASATIWDITPTHGPEGDQENCNLYRALKTTYAQPGDTIRMASGDYAEPYTTNIPNSVVIMAADGARPVVKMSGYFQLSADSVKFEGVVFDHTDVTTNSYGIYVTGTDVTRLTFEDCEFKGFNMYCVSCAGGAHIDSVVVNNSYFHNLTNGAFYFGATNNPDSTTNYCDYLSVKNSTFANIDISKWVAVIDIRNNDGNGWKGAQNKMEVDHCTFYNCYGTYQPVVMCYVSPQSSITNCIFANSAMPANDNYANYTYGGVVKNCLAYNNKGFISWGATLTDNITDDPLFLDAANGNYTLGIGSPAIGVATDGSNLGDPFWGKARTIYCKMEYDWWTTGSAAIGAYAWGEGVPAYAAWPGVRMTRVSADSENPEYKTWKIDLPEKYTSVVFTRMNPSNEGDQYWGAKTNDLVIPAHLNLYTITSDEEKWDDDTHDHQKVAGSWSTKDAKFYIVGSMTDWEDAKKIGCTEDSYTLKGLAAGIHQFKIVDAENGAWLGMADLKNIASGGLFLYPDTYGNICFKLATAGDATITFKKNTELTVEGDLTVPAMSIVGSLVGGWDPEDITPMEAALDMKTATYTVENLAVQDGYEFKLIFDGMWITREGDDDTYYTIHSGWKKVDGLRQDSNGKKSIKLNASEAGNYIFTWDYMEGTMYVAFPSDATGIENTEAEMKAVKRIENGQLIIEKAGKKYNAIGVEIK